MISTIASLLHLPAIDNPIEAKRMLGLGHYLVLEDDIKPVVLKLRSEYDALMARHREAIAILERMAGRLPSGMGFGAQDRLQAMEDARMFLRGDR